MEREASAITTEPDGKAAAFPGRTMKLSVSASALVHLLAIVLIAALGLGARGRQAGEEAITVSLAGAAPELSETADAPGRPTPAPPVSARKSTAREVAPEPRPDDEAAPKTALEPQAEPARVEEEAPAEVKEAIAASPVKEAAPEAHVERAPVAGPPEMQPLEARPPAGLPGPSPVTYEAPYSGGASTVGGAGASLAGAEGPEGQAALVGLIKASIQGAVVYPTLARKRRMEGSVLAGFSIDGAGMPVDIRVIESSGHGILDDEVVRTIRRASPYPVLRMRIEVPVTFRLAGGG